MTVNNDSFDTHLQNAIWGIPLLRPDEQHRYLGTFYERVDLRITFEQALTRDFTNELVSEIHQDPQLILLLHGKLDDDILGRYIKLAHQTKTAFAIRTDRYYHHDRTCSAIILCGNHPLEVTETDIIKRFPQPISTNGGKVHHHWFKRH